VFEGGREATFLGGKVGKLCSKFRKKTPADVAMGAVTVGL